MQIVIGSLVELKPVKGLRPEVFRGVVDGVAQAGVVGRGIFPMVSVRGLDYWVPLTDCSAVEPLTPDTVSNILESRARELVDAITSRRQVLGPLGVVISDEPLNDTEQCVDAVLRALEQTRAEALAENRRGGLT